MNNQTEKDQLIELMEKNLKLSEEIYASNVKIRKYMLIRTIISIIWIVIIVAPIIWAIIWLPSHFNDYIRDFSNGENLKIINKLN